MMKNIMFKWMKSGVYGIVAATFFAGIICSSVYAQQGETLYAGRPAAQAGIKIGSWGGSTVKEVSKGSIYSGSRAIEVTANGLFSGGRVDFLTPYNLTSEFKDPSAYLQVVCKFGADTGTTGGRGIFPGGMPGMPGGMPGMPGMGGGAGGRNGMMMPGGMPGMGGRGGTGMPGMSGTVGANVPIPSKRMQIIIEFDNGQYAECEGDVGSFSVNEDGWMNISFPLAVIKRGLEMTDFKVKRIAVCGDGTEVFRIGEIFTDFDTSPLSASIESGEDKEVARNDKVSFTGYCNAGASAVKYSWDFDASDGIQEEGLGEIVYHRFRKATDKQPYIVTLTVSDTYGIKKPVTATIAVKVNE